MTNADLHPSLDPLEASLIDLFAVTPRPIARRRMDERVRGALEAWQPRRPLDRVRPGRRAGAGLLLAAAFFVMAASGGLQSLLVLLSGPFDLPWHRGTAIGLSQVHDGYRVTVDRVYADATRLAVALTIVDELERTATTQLQGFGSIVSDAGGEYGGFGGTSHPDGRWTATAVSWKVPATLPLPAGPRRIHLELPHIQVYDGSTGTFPPDGDESGWVPWREVPGPWVFDFEVTVEGGGVTVEPDVATTADGLTVSVERLITAPSIVRLEVRGSGLTGDFAPHGEIRHGAQVLRIVAADLDAPGGVIALVTDTGVEDPSGHWTVTLQQAGDPGPAGPWVLEFDVP